ncbi:MAG: STAS domain-containing protein [Planctomycetaceae bacterium]
MDLKHKVFPVEKQPRVLVVTPAGDAVTFKDCDVKWELTTILNMLEKLPFHNLLVDFSGANYFGSTVIGSMVRVASLIRERDGKAAMYGASDEMQVVLDAMNLHQVWSQFEDRNEALRWLNS